MIHEEMVYVVQCDGCGEILSLDGENHACFASLEEMIDALADADWEEVGGKYYCYECVSDGKHKSRENNK